MNPFAALVDPPRARLPKMPSTTVVIEGKRITDVRQINRKDREETDDLAALEQTLLRKAVQAAKAAARYQRARLDPEKMAKRAAWYQANKEKVKAYKKKWDKKNLKKLRAQKLSWQTRAYRADPEKYQARSREYYAKNRERILAALAEKARLKKDASEAAHG